MSTLLVIPAVRLDEAFRSRWEPGRYPLLVLGRLCGQGLLFDRGEPALAARRPGPIAEQVLVA